MANPNLVSRRPSKEVLDRYTERIDSGEMNRRQIADELGVHISVVYVWLPKNLPPPHNPAQQERSQRIRTRQAELRAQLQAEISRITGLRETTP
jgi:transposase